MKMTPEKVKYKLFSYKTLVHAIAGSTGSAVAMTAFYPLDTVRSRLQLEDRESKNIWLLMLELVREEGIGRTKHWYTIWYSLVNNSGGVFSLQKQVIMRFRIKFACFTYFAVFVFVHLISSETLYRGILPVLKSLWTSNFVYFYTFHGIKHLGGDEKVQNAFRDLFIATIAGIVNVLTTTPLWVVNTRLKMKGLKDEREVNYKGLIDGLLQIRKEEGIQALWSGTIPSLVLVGNPAIQFMIYETLKRQLLKIYPNRDCGALDFFVIGAISKGVATVLTYPIQLVQAKLRHGHKYPDLEENVGMREMTLYIFKKYGLKGLFKGMEAKILQTVLTAALMLATYEKIALFVFKIFRARRTI